MSKIAIALGGGGTRGAYQMGIWRAINDLGINLDIVVGSSVGAIMGAMMVQNEYDNALKVWDEMDEHFVINQEIIDGLATGKRKEKLAVIKKMIEQGGADITPLENNIEKYINEEKIRKSEIDFGIVTVEFPSFKSIEIPKKDIPEGKICDYITASASCFPAFRAKDIDGVKFIDGGYYDNIPINLAFDMGADSVIAVDLKSRGLTQNVREEYKGKIVTYVSSHWSLGSFLVFDKDVVSRNKSLGYNETMKAFKKLDGDKYTFEKGEELENNKYMEKRLANVLARLDMVDVDKRLSAIDKIAKRRIDTYLDGEYSETGYSKINTLAELAGELFQIDAEFIYRFSKFNDILISELEVRLEHLDKTKGLKELMENMDKSHSIAFIYKNLLDDIVNFSGTNKEITMFATLSPDVFCAALYLLALNIDEIIA